MRGSASKKARNDQNKRLVKDVVKKFEKAAKTDKKEAEKMLPKAYATIDKAAKRGIFKKNTAARKKSRLTRLVA